MLEIYIPLMLVSFIVNFQYDILAYEPRKRSKINKKDLIVIAIHGLFPLAIVVWGIGYLIASVYERFELGKYGE